ncbi:MAG: biotin/lipoyl-binding protein [Armatimonadetes bacterium]|nr:biotin/lipoyl-binding protein [Armatimonadota bacterium]
MNGFEQPEIEAIIAAAKRHGLTRVEVQEEGRCLRIELAGVCGEPPHAAETPAWERNSETIVRSGLVGVFRLPTPEPVEGADLEPDTVMGVIEALGLPNEVTAGVKGRLAAMLVTDGQPVEYGQPLARIEVTES